MRLAFSIVLLPLLPAEITGKDAGFISIAKTVYCSQNSPAAPIVQTNGFVFAARVDLARPGTVSASTLKLPPPSTGVRTLADLNDRFEYSSRFPTTQALNLAQPNGTYTLITQTASDGIRTNVLTLSADVYPNPVRIANFSAAQAVNARADFVLQWDPPATTANDFIQVRIFANDQLVFQTGGIPGAPGTLGGLATAVTIPKNSLPDGALFRAQVIANRRSTFDATGYPGVPAWAMYGRATEFPLRTIFPTLDVRWYGVAKIKRFVQTSILPPAQLPSGAFGLTAFALASDPLNLKSASLKLPNGTLRPLAAAGGSWSFNAFTDTQQLLDNAYSAGAYEITMDTLHNGAQKIPLTLGNTAFSPPLQIANWNEATAIDATQPFSLKWLAPAGATVDDFCQVILSRSGEVILRSGDYPLAPGALDGRATTFTIPAGLLQPGEAAEIVITFLKSAVDTYSYPQAVGTTAFGCETRATIRARGGTVVPPILSSFRAQNGVFEFAISSVAGRQYTIQSAADFQTWRDLFTTNAPGGSFNFRLPATQHALGFRVLTQ